MSGRKNCFIVSSTQVQSRAVESTLLETDFLRDVGARRGPSPAAFAIHRASARPAGSSNSTIYIRKAYCLREGVSAVRCGKGAQERGGLADRGTRTVRTIAYVARVAASQILSLMSPMAF